MCARAVPCKYLGIPLSLKKLWRCGEQALVDKISAKIPMWKSRLLTHAGHVLLTNVTISAIPGHISIACYLSSWVPSACPSQSGMVPWSCYGLTLGPPRSTVQGRS